MLQRAARNAYSWWWASHIRTKQSKWLDQNLQDMEEKVEYILKIIDEDGDTFAQKAEMYYRKRPELMNFVEDSFRCYRALAERYDHLSRELQSANRTIATVFPERVHLEMDDDLGENFHPNASISSESGYKPKGANVPTAPNLSTGKLPSFQKKGSKKPSRLMSKKGLIKFNADDVGPTPPISGLTKAEALQEIDKIQKEILGLQTEGEFMKSSFERVMEKYKEIEKRVTENQAKVSGLQDEFGIGMVIDDDEARTLMTNSALKSCQEALVHLLEKQKQSAHEAKEEHLKIQTAREKMAAFREKFGCNEKEIVKKNVEKEVDVIDIDVEFLRGKIKERLGFDSCGVLTMAEMADKVDELVDNVINLETAVCSQTSNLERLRSATNELESHLQSLECDNGGSNNLSHKMRELDEEFQEVQSLDQNIQMLNNDLRMKAAKASVSLDELSEKLPNVRPDDDAELNMSFNEDDSHLHHGEVSMNGDLTSVDNLQVFDNVLYVEGKKAFPNNPFSDPSIDVSKELQFQKAINMKVEDEKKNGIPINDDGMNADDVLGEEREKKVDILSYSSNLLGGDPMPNDSKASVPNISVNECEKKQNIPPSVHCSVIAEDERPISGGHQFHKSSSMKSIDDNCFNGQTRYIIHNPEISSVNKETIKHEVSDHLPNSFEDGNLQREPNENVLPNQAEKHKTEREKAENCDSRVEQEKLEIKEDEEEEEPDWKQLFLSDLDDKERILLQEYTKVLRNYKEVKKKLNEVEKKRRASLFQTAVQIKVLTRSNSSKKAEIQSLKRKLDLLQENHDETNDSNFQILTLAQTEFPGKSDEQVIDWTDTKGEYASRKRENVVLQGNEDVDFLNVDEALPLSSLEDRIRTEIDDLLEENIEFWLRFSTSFHQIQKFQTSVKDLQAEVARVKEKKHELAGNRTQSLHSEIRPIYRHLREIQTELSLLLEQNGVLKDDLQNRLSSLSNLQEELTRLSNADEKGELNEYQAAKFQGEIMNMKQENKKVADELEVGVKKVKELQGEIQKTLSELDQELGIRTGNDQQHSHRSRIPLRSFLFGVKLKKQRPSLFSCINPAALQRQNSDLTTSQT